MLISKFDVTQVDSGVKWQKILLQVCSHTINKKSLVSVICKYAYDRKGFPYENTTENVFIIWNEKKKS